MASTKRYHYKCSAPSPHEFWHPKEQTRCIGYHLGSPCQADIKPLKS